MTKERARGQAHYMAPSKESRLKLLKNACLIPAMLACTHKCHHIIMPAHESHEGLKSCRALLNTIHPVPTNDARL